MERVDLNPPAANGAVVQVVGRACIPVIACVALISACSTREPHPPPQLPAAQESGQHQVHDLGRIFVAPDEHRQLKLRHVFQVRNGTAEPLILKSAGSSCGCTQCVTPSDPVLPSQTGDVEVTIDAVGASGPVMEYADVQPGDATDKRIRLTLTATVFPRFEIEGLQETSIRVRPGTEKIVTFRLLGRRPLSESSQFEFSEHTSNDDWFSLHLEDPVERVLDEEYRLVVANGHLRVRCPSDIRDPSQTLAQRELQFRLGDLALTRTVLIRPHLEIEAFPVKPVVFRKGGEVAQATFQLRSQQPFAILSVRSSSDVVTVDVDLNHSVASHELRLSTALLESIDMPKAGSFQIDVETDMPSQRHFHVNAHLVDLD